MIKRLKTNRIIWHHSLSGDVSVDTVRSWHVDRGFEDIGYHYIIDSWGNRFEGREQSLIGAHAKGKNVDSIGVCLLGNFNVDFPKFEALVEAKALYHQLCRIYSKELKNEFHRWVYNPCPGRRFNRSHFVAELKGAI